MTTAHPIRGRDSGLRSLECGPPTSLEKTGNSNHMGSGGALQKRPFLFPLASILLSSELTFFLILQIRVCLSPVGEILPQSLQSSDVYGVFFSPDGPVGRAKWVLCFREEMECKYWHVQKSHSNAEKAGAPAPSSILHKTTVRVFGRVRILIKDE